MAGDRNFLQLHGTIYGEPKIALSKSGGELVKFFIEHKSARGKRSRFSCTSFSGTVVGKLRGLIAGDYVGIVGAIGWNNWKDREEKWHNDFQIIVDTVEKLITGHEEQVDQSYYPEEQQTKDAPQLSNPLDSIPF